MRKHIACLISILAFISIYGQQSSPPVIEAKMAKEYIGKEATVCGTVVSARYAAVSRGSPTFLNFERPYPDQVFTVVIWGSDRAKFGKPEVEYKGKRVCVTGKIESYRGVPQIVLKDPQQIRVQEP
ncbi:MAG: DNA-binding protein [Blastocatellia bacterium]|nr:DNA-binding protein [Blastocatellia bacterium]MCX7752301.1 DNA-binding protein [Blastocatellia bacterium]MDW8255918.1 DNA-binding protein [Acidobacteriota bacterium]